MVKLIGRKIPNIYIIGAMMLLAYGRPDAFKGATGAVGTIGDTLKSLGTGSTALIRGVLPFSELGEEFTGFSKGLDDLLNPIDRLIDIGGRLIPFGSSGGFVGKEITDASLWDQSKGIWMTPEEKKAKSNDPADVAIPPGTVDPPVIIHGDDYGG